jgi:N-carbamoyl-L-amino-acid hydrolase
MTVDLRASDDDLLTSMHDTFLAQTRELAVRNGVSIDVRQVVYFRRSHSTSG